MSARAPTGSRLSERHPEGSGLWSSCRLHATEHFQVFPLTSPFRPSCHFLFLISLGSKRKEQLSLGETEAQQGSRSWWGLSWTPRPYTHPLPTRSTPGPAELQSTIRL